MLLLLMVLAFTSVFFAFNIFTNRYIQSSVEAQLDDLTKNFSIKNDRHQDNPQGELQLPDISGQHSNRIGVRGEVVIFNSDYEVKDFNAFSVGVSADELTQIANKLKEKNVDLASVQSVKIDTTNGEYYVSSTEDINYPGSYFVFYVSVAGINNLVNAINIAMGIIVAIAMLICFVIANLIANSVTKPLKRLSKFAGEISKGDFNQIKFDFSDIEFDELGEAMNESAEKLDLYDKDQRAFFQNVSHELRTPLQSIRCYAEGVEHELMEPKR